MLNYEQIIYFFNVLLLKLLRHSCNILIICSIITSFFLFPLRITKAFSLWLFHYKLKKTPPQIWYVQCPFNYFHNFFFERKKANTQLKRKKLLYREYKQYRQALIETINVLNLFFYFFTLRLFSMNAGSNSLI